jgi:hypothetical protein
MCPHTTKHKIKSTRKTSKIKQSHKSSYTIPKKLPNERCGECAKTKINVFWFKATFVFGRRSMLANG